MKILFVQREYNPYKGGVQRVTSLLSKYFENSNIKCYYLFKNEQDTQLADLTSDCYRIITPHKSNDIIQFIIENKIDMIINQHLYEAFVIQLYKELKKKNPHIVILNTFHNTPDDFLHFINPIVYKVHNVIKRILGIKTRPQLICEMYEVVDKMVLLSTSYIDIFKKYYHIDDNGAKLCSIANPLTFEVEPSSIKINDKQRTVLVAARLSSQKNLFSLLRIWKKVEQQVGDWNLIIAGTGEDENKLKSYSKKLKLSNITFKGHVTNIKTLYETSAILAITSKFEGFPMSLLESMQMGNPAIAFDTFRVLDDINAVKQCVIAIPPFDEHLYAKNLIGLMQNKDLRDKMANNALIVANNYSLDKIGKKWILLFEEIFKNK